MIGRLGELALAGGVLAALAAALLWLRVELFGQPSRLAWQATLASLGAATLAGGCLEWALLRHDFSLRYVVANGGRDVSGYDTITSLWAAPDGSLLLWLLILTGYGALLGRVATANPTAASPPHCLAMVVYSVVTLFFFALSRCAANPFQRVTPATTGGFGPNPLLREHPAMALHPPMLYAGYLGLVVPFSYAVAALLTGRIGAGWLRAARPWLVASWTLLTGGIALGAWWSYAVLGWGGYWSWDPVENASLLPWLAATALLHVAVAQRHGSAPPLWGVPVGCACFLLVLLGTFLTRSGAVASVHAFSASTVGPLLLGFAVVVTMVVASLTAWRSSARPARHPGSRPGGVMLSRETGLLCAGILLATLTATVLIGTVFPLVTSALPGGGASVGAPYFNRTAIPVALVVLGLMAVAPQLRWGGDSPRVAARRLAVPATVALATVAGVAWASSPGLLVLLAFGTAAAVATSVASTVTGAARAVTGTPPARAHRSRRRRCGGAVAHLGLAVLAMGVAGSAGYATAVERQLGLGETLTAQGVTAQLSRLTTTRAGDPTATAVIRLRSGGERIGVLRPRLRHYQARDLTVAIPAIRARPAADVYLTLTEVDETGTKATIRLAVNPLVTLVWIGGALVAAGGLLTQFEPGAVRDRIALEQRSARR